MGYDINSAKLSAMRTAFIMKFQGGGKLAGSNYQEFCMVEGDMAHTAIEFPFLQSFAFMREWVGPRQVKNLASQKLRIVEKAFEDTVSIPLRDVQSDNWNQYAHILVSMGQGCEALWDRLAAEALLNPAPWIDGEEFFSTGREYGDGNLIRNTDPGELTAANFEKAYAAMQLYNAHNGEPMEVTPDLLIVGPELRAAAWEIIKLERVPATGNGNISVANRNFDLVKIQVNPRLRGKNRNRWFLAQTAGSVRPVVLQKSISGELTALDKPSDPNVFNDNKVIYGAKAYGNAACAFPHLIYRGGSLSE